MVRGYKQVLEITLENTYTYTYFKIFIINILNFDRIIMNSDLITIRLSLDLK